MPAVYSLTRDVMITATLQQCGALAKGDAPDATDISDCLVYLQSMLKYWDTQGKKAYCYLTADIPCIAAQASYTIGAGGNVATIDRPIAITYAYTINPTTLGKQPLRPLTKQEFEMLSPRSQPGPSNGYFYDAQINLGVFYPWPVPIDTSQNFTIVAQRPLADVVNNSVAVFDVPQEAYLALIFGLAELVGPIYGVEDKTQNKIDAKAARFLDSYMNFAEEDGSIYFQIDTQGGGR